MKTKLAADGLGLIVPMNVEAMCVDANAGSRFRREPYDFTRLPDGEQSEVPYLSEMIMTGDGKTLLDVGIHLHWALPDGLTKGTGRQNGEGNISFAKTPDRWLVSRVYSDLSNPANPVNRVKSWVIESNYISLNQPDQDRPSIAVPFREQDPDKQQYRFLGRVLEYEAWRSQYLLKKGNLSENNDTDYVNGLSAVGYGTPTFSASYHTSKSVFGFHDKDEELTKLGKDILLSYHVVGWYHTIGDDPVNQLPMQFKPAEFDKLSGKLPDAEKAVLKQAYQPVRDQDDEITAYVQIDKISPQLQLNVINALASAGFDFLHSLLQRCDWSLPSGTIETKPQVTHTLLTGLISNVKWNRDKNEFRQMSEQIDIAVGNTASQALAALIADISEVPQVPNVELLLDALQLGKLAGVGSAAELNRLEDLAAAIHTSGFTSSSSGTQWAITKIEQEEEHGLQGLSALAPTLGDYLNELNKRQLQYDMGLRDIESAKSQLFMDWYRLILIIRQGQAANAADGHNISPPVLKYLLQQEIEDLEKKNDEIVAIDITGFAASIARQLPAGYKLVTESAARYWQPTEPVVLFQGKEITPPERYGGDGRFMADKTMVCRLSSQVVKRVTIAAGTIGNDKELAFNADNTPHMAERMPLDYEDQIHALFTEGSLLNPLVMSLLCKQAGAGSDRTDIAATIKSLQNAYMSPAVPDTLSATRVDEIKEYIAAGDYAFLMTQYKKQDDDYKLAKSLTDITADDLKHLQYIFISVNERPKTAIVFEGYVPSPVYFVEWDHNPWLPFALDWTVTYFPIAETLPASEKNYDQDFITKNFRLDGITYKYNGKAQDIKIDQTYSNFIFLSPHAEENFQVQIKKFIDAQPDASIGKDLKKVLDKLRDYPILSQSLNGLNSRMLMRNQIMQLEVKDVVKDSYTSITQDVKGAIGNGVGTTDSAPKVTGYYNPIRAGFVKIDSLRVVDVFGSTYDVPPAAYKKIKVAQNLKIIDPGSKHFYLAPQLAQSSRLQFRWLSASNVTVDTNSHPATSPVCGWIVANHLQESLWFYTSEGAPIGTLNLYEDQTKVVWQVAPGSSLFKGTITEYFNSAEGKRVNKELKNLAIALYNGGNDASFLKSFIKANDIRYSTIQPQNGRQFGGNAILMGSPIAVTQASLSLELKGQPAYRNSWEDLEDELNRLSDNREKGVASVSGLSRNDSDFTKVKFPVRLGNSTQTNDGLLGYFKNNNYDQYYAIEAGTQKPGKVIQSTDTDIKLTLDEAAHECIVTLLLDPRGIVHATSGILPVKTINIPPVQFADVLENLEMAFLATPILYSAGLPAMPVPAADGSEWKWLQAEPDGWIQSKIEPVDDRAHLDDVPQEIREGWLLLKSLQNQSS